MKKNKLVRVPLPGGAIGLLIANPEKAIGNAIAQGNEAGWRAVQFEPFVDWKLLGIVVLVCTLGCFTFGSGYFVLFEKED